MPSDQQNKGRYPLHKSLRAYQPEHFPVNGQRWVTSQPSRAVGEQGLPFQSANLVTPDPDPAPQGNNWLNFAPGLDNTPSAPATLYQDAPFELPGQYTTVSHRPGFDAGTVPSFNPPVAQTRELHGPNAFYASSHGICTASPVQGAPSNTDIHIPAPLNHSCPVPQQPHSAVSRNHNRPACAGLDDPGANPHLQAVGSGGYPSGQNVGQTVYNPQVQTQANANADTSPYEFVHGFMVIRNGQPVRFVPDSNDRLAEATMPGMRNRHLTTSYNTPTTQLGMAPCGATPYNGEAHQSVMGGGPAAGEPVASGSSLGGAFAMSSAYPYEPVTQGPSASPALQTRTTAPLPRLSASGASAPPHAGPSAHPHAFSPYGAMQDTRRGQRGRNAPAAAEGTASGRRRRTSSANAHPGSSAAGSRAKPEEPDLSAYTGVFSCSPGF